MNDAPSDRPHTPASLLDWAEILLCNSRRMQDCPPFNWSEQVKAWRDAKNALSLHPQPTVSPTPDPPARDQSVYCNFPEPALSHPTLQEINKEAVRYVNSTIGSTFAAFQAGANWALKVSLDRQECDAKFVRAGHKPADPTCEHAAYTAHPEPRPRHCPTCGTCMWDAGD